jgi:hypothetical protein
MWHWLLFKGLGFGVELYHTKKEDEVLEHFNVDLGFVRFQHIRPIEIEESEDEIDVELEDAK